MWLQSGRPKTKQGQSGACLGQGHVWSSACQGAGERMGFQRSWHWAGPLGEGCLSEGTGEALEWVLYQGSSRPFRKEEAGLGRAYMADLGIWAPSRRERGGLGC